MPGGLGKPLKILHLAQNDLQSGLVFVVVGTKDDIHLPVNASELGMYPLLEELDLSRNQVWKAGFYRVFTKTFFIRFRACKSLRLPGQVLWSSSTSLITE